MALDIDLKELSKRLNLHRFVRGSLCVIDHNGHVIISSDEKELGTTNKYFNKIVDVSGEFVEKSEESIYIYQLIDQMDFYILAQVSKENILKEFKPLRQLAVIIGIISIVFSIIIISTTIKIIEKFLSKVTKTLDNVSEGKYENNIKDYENLISNQIYFNIRVSQQILPEYLVWYLNSEEAKLYYEKNTSGATVKSINRKVLEHLKIEIPSLEKQKELVSLISRFLIEKEKTLKYLEKKEKLINEAIKKVAKGGE